MHYHMMTLRKLSLTILPSCEESHPPHLMQTDGNRGRQLQLIYRIDALWEAAQGGVPCLPLPLRHTGTVRGGGDTWPDKLSFPRKP